MGKKDRLKRERAIKQKQEAEWTQCSIDSLVGNKFSCHKYKYEIRIKDPAKLIRHALKVDPNYIETAKFAVAARKAKGDKYTHEDEVHLTCFNILRQGHVPLRICEECGVNCVFQRRAPDPRTRIIIYDKNQDFVEICLTNTSKLALAAGLNQTT